VFDQTNGIFGLSYVGVGMRGEDPGEIIVGLGVVWIELNGKTIVGESLVDFALGEENVAEVAVSNPGVGVFSEGVLPEGSGIFVDGAVVPGKGCECNEE